MNYSMVLATLLTIYPNVYAFFATFNYINDSFAAMWYTQVIFSFSFLPF